MWARASRRRFVQGAGVAGLGLLAGCGRLPGQVQAPAKLPRIGYLGLGSSGPNPGVEAFRQGLRDLGYIEGQNIVVEYRLADGRYSPTPDPGELRERLRSAGVRRRG